MLVPDWNKPWRSLLNENYGIKVLTEFAKTDC